MDTMRKLSIAVIVAGLLSGPVLAQQEDIVRAHQAIDHAGEYAMVCGVIASARYNKESKGAPTYLNFDKPYPGQDFSAIIFAKNRKNFSPEPETLTGYKACVYGKVKIYKGKAQIELVKADQLSVKPPK
jgi:hypothetical protein